MKLKHLLNALHIYKSYLLLPNTISKPTYCYSLKKLVSNSYYFDDDIIPTLDCNCTYTCRYKQGGQPKLKYYENVIHLHDTI